MKPNHTDAIGYLSDLAKEINEPWFKMVCDLAAVSSVSVLDEPTRDTLFALYTNRASYIGIRDVFQAGARLRGGGLCHSRRRVVKKWSLTNRGASQSCRSHGKEQEAELEA
jgi:hypothetical protein